jgi:hypothetical protein
LEHAAIHQDLKTILAVEIAAGVDEMFGTSDCPGCA